MYVPDDIIEVPPSFRMLGGFVVNGSGEVPYDFRIKNL